MINQGTTATFINDIIVATEIEKGYNEVVEEVLKWLEKNDLFVKLESASGKSERWSS